MQMIVARAGGQTRAIRVARPRFQDLWQSYPVGMAAADVYKLVGGNAYDLYLGNPNAYANACALRLSRSFNYGGMRISRQHTGYKVRGGDGLPYYVQVKAILAFIESNWGQPEKAVAPAGRDLTADFQGKTGVLAFMVSGWTDASGHVTLWDGNACGDSCYFVHASPSTRTTEIRFWELK